MNATAWEATGSNREGECGCTLIESEVDTDEKMSSLSLLGYIQHLSNVLPLLTLPYTECESSKLQYFRNLPRRCRDSGDDKNKSRSHRPFLEAARGT